MLQTRSKHANRSIRCAALWVFQGASCEALSESAPRFRRALRASRDSNWWTPLFGYFRSVDRRFLDDSYRLICASLRA
jgi:hypothetical protein